MFRNVVVLRNEALSSSKLEIVTANLLHTHRSVLGAIYQIINVRNREAFRLLLFMISRNRNQIPEIR